MSWAESEKLNEWIHRAYENGRAEERERIIKLIDAYAIKDLTLDLDNPLKESLAFVANTYANMGHDFGVIDERERIIKLLEELKAEKLTPEQALEKGWCFDESIGRWWLPQEILIALIKGENK